MAEKRLTHWITDEGEKIPMGDNRVNCVSYRQFGAKLDGMTDDSVAIAQAHDLANASGLPIVEHGGKILCNFSVEVKTDMDLSGCDFIMDDSTPNGGVYKLMHDATRTITKSVTITDDQKKTEDADFFNSFFVLKNETDSTWLLGLRNSGDTYSYHHQQPVAVDAVGNIISAPIFRGTSGNLTFLLSDLRERPISIKGGKVIYRGSNLGFKQLLNIERNNVYFSDFSVECESAPNTTSEQRGLFYIHDCCNVEAERIYAQNHSVNITDSHSYVFDIFNTFAVTLRKCVMYTGWGANATHFVDKMLIDDCVINRADNHYGCFGTFDIRNSKFVQNCVISFGYGNATYNIRDVDIDTGAGTPEGGSNYYPLYFRSDFRVVYGGRINISGLSVRGSVNRLFNLTANSGGTAHSNLQKETAEIFISDSKLDTKQIFYLTNYAGEKIKIAISNSDLYNLAVGSGGKDYISLSVYDCTIEKDDAVCVSTLQNCEIGTISAMSGQQKAKGCFVKGAITLNGGSLLLAECELSKNVTVEDAYLVNCYALAEITSLSPISNCSNIRYVGASAPPQTPDEPSEPVTETVTPTWKNQYISTSNGTITFGSNTKQLITDYIPVSAGNVVSVETSDTYQTRLYFFDANDGTYVNKDSSDAYSTGSKTYTVKSGMSYMVVSARNVDNNQIVPVSAGSDFTIKITRS